MFSGNYPGLYWVNPEKTVFRIPWKHAGKFSWKEEDCLIFKVGERLIADNKNQPVLTGNIYCRGQSREARLSEEYSIARLIKRGKVSS